MQDAFAIPALRRYRQLTKWPPCQWKTLFDKTKVDSSWGTPPKVVLWHIHTHKYTEPQFPGSVQETCIHVWAHSNVLHLASCVNLCKIRKEEHWRQRRQKKTPLVSHFHSLSTLLLGKCINLIKTKCNSNAPIWFKNNLHSRQDIKIQLRLFEESLRCILCCEAALCQETQTFLNVTNVFSSLPLAQMPLPIRF